MKAMQKAATAIPLAPGKSFRVDVALVEEEGSPYVGLLRVERSAPA
jgi:hypothetical protein